MNGFYKYDLNHRFDNCDVINLCIKITQLVLNS